LPKACQPGVHEKSRKFNATRGNFDEIFNFDFAAAFILVDGEHQMECVYESGQRQRFLFVEKMQFKIFTA